ncbi:MAG TPA: nucleotidyltransferase family protein [Candidatus Methylomirabilis sp.]|nr:nucleotidyltransferase family protein [Candidatus Methylomirabilis sp.]
MRKNEKIAPIILAAGSSERFGMPKALARFGGKTAIQIAVENCAGYEMPVVVLGCDAEQVLPEVPRGTKIVVNSQWREGQLSSLLCALEHVAPTAAMLVYPVDHALLVKKDVAQLVKEYRRRRPAEEILMPRYGKQYGHPILLAAALRDELFRAKTARDVVYRIPERLRVFEAQSAAIYEDFHTPETYQECAQEFLVRKREEN